VKTVKSELCRIHQRLGGSVADTRVEVAGDAHPQDTFAERLMALRAKSNRLICPFGSWRAVDGVAVVVCCGRIFGWRRCCGRVLARSAGRGTATQSGRCCGRAAAARAVLILDIAVLVTVGVTAAEPAWPLALAVTASVVRMAATIRVLPRLRAG
jgi:hypothetical protein